MSGPSSYIDPFQAVSWPLVPGRTALVNIDLQNDVLHPEGRYAKAGVDVSHMRRVIGPICQLVEEAHRKNIPVIWTRHGFKSEADAGILFPLRPFLREGGFRQGTWGYELYGELPVAEEDWIVEKNRFSAFYNTNLELILRGLNVETVLITGVLTNQCISATARDTFHRDMKPVVVEECTGTTLPELHEPALRMIDVGFGQVRTLKDVLDELKRLQAAA